MPGGLEVEVLRRAGNGEVWVLKGVLGGREDDDDGGGGVE
jgi:hypothetical protein